MKKDTLDYLYSLKPVEKITRYWPETTLPIAMSYINLDYDLAEFGTGHGVSTQVILKNKPINSKLYTFDWFNGLPEDWSFSDGRIFKNYIKGHLKTNFPIWISGLKDAKLYYGLFQDTIDKFLRDYKKPLSFINMDADLYSSTKFVLNKLYNRIIPGTIIHFDEYYNYDLENEGWKEHEYRAFMEFVDKFNKHFEYLGRSNHWQVWLRITN